MRYRMGTGECLDFVTDWSDDEKQVILEQLYWS